MRSPNIILVTLDTMRADRLGRVRSGRLLTPNLSALGADGRVFTQAVAAGIPTYFGFPAIFRGGLALDRGKVIGIPPGATTFVEELRSHGYKTAAVIASNPYLSHYYRYDTGFDIFDDFYMSKLEGRSRRETRRSMRLVRRMAGEATTARLRRVKAHFNYARECVGGANPALHEGSRGEMVTERAMSLIRESESEGPFFLWLHYMDLHGYFYSTQRDRRAVMGVSGPLGDAVLRWRRYRYVERWTGQIIRSQEEPPDHPVGHTRMDRETLTGFYDAAMLYADRSLGPLIDWIRGSGDTVAFVTADHGEEFYDHGKIGHAPIAVHDEVARVPLIVFGPGVTGGEIPGWVSHSSLPVSILEAAGVASDMRTSSDRYAPPSLLEGVPSNGPVFTETLYGVRAPFPRRRFDEHGLLMACRFGRHKYVWREMDGAEQLFDVVADRGEKRDLLGTPAVAQAEDMLRSAVRRRATEIGIRDSRAKLDAATRTLATSMGLR
ncbi:MAG: sulfatase-like hydrolase/transferase [Candidatus Eisenbacteria bacterium]|nr:sulfatase-like hydrolase/transferase [Candidatus Eisenbacteria bacterium]